MICARRKNGVKTFKTISIINLLFLVTLKSFMANGRTVCSKMHHINQARKSTQSS